MKNGVVLLIVLLTNTQIYNFKINRAILSTNENPMYIDFWPIVAKAWKQLIGVTPTLALIAPQNVPIDTSLGDVIRFEPIPGIPTGYQAQVIRNLLPSLFPNDFCIIGDIDMIPVNKNYLIGSALPFAEKNFVVYRNLAYGPRTVGYPMCYNAAKGSTFAEIFNVKNKKDIYDIIKYWHTINNGWSADEQLLFKYLHNWKFHKSRCRYLNQTVLARLDRGKWNPKVTLLKKHAYIDIHSIRPYKQHEQHLLWI